MNDQVACNGHVFLSFVPGLMLEQSPKGLQRIFLSEKASQSIKNQWSAPEQQ